MRVSDAALQDEDRRMRRRVPMKGRRDIRGGLERLLIERQRLFGAQVDRLGALAHAVGLDVESNLLAVDEGAQA
jgi:hypothetical protein